MPKSTSPPTTNKSSKPSQEAGDANLLRKKKNADAQAAFRARRQNYISTLEETVTSLESVVLQLQESSRETRRENMELRQELSRLRYESREREKYWRTLSQTRKPSQATDDMSPPTLSSPYLGHATTALLPQQEPYAGNLSYRASDPSACQEYDNAGNFASQPTTVAFPNQEDTDGSSESLPGRGGKYTAYPYTINGSSRDERWSMPGLAGLNSCDRVNQSQSPYMEPHSSTTSTEMSSYPGRYHDERKVELGSALNDAPYVFPSGNRYQNVADGIPNSRSMSPTTSTTSSATSLPLTSYQIPFQDTPTGHDRADFDYRSSSLPQCPDISLHGGLADISLAGQPSDPGGYRLTRRSESSSGEHHNSEQMSRNNSQPDEALRLRGRRNALHPYHRSPSPAPPQLSCTVAVIKAQAFGALRRTRTKTKKSTDGAAKVAQDVLEARGIGVGSAATNSAKPSRVEDGIDMETP